MIDALGLIKQHGIFGLCYSDGCACCHFEVHHICVDVSCRKSGGGVENFYGNVVRVHSASDPLPSELEAIAREVTSQVIDYAGSGLPTAVRYCSWDQDHSLKCSYCGKAKAAMSYLCEACETGNDAFGGKIRERFPFADLYAGEPPQ